MYKKIAHLIPAPLKRLIRKAIAVINARLAISKERVEKIREEIEAQSKGKTVYIFQHQFFDITGTKCFNGGAERYCTDLATILKKRGYGTVLIQMGDPALKKCWHKNIRDLEIIGVPLAIFEYTFFLKTLRKYEFVIYSGMVEWGEKINLNILISHGVTWDVPHVPDVKVEDIFNIMKDVDHFISVDTNTISWLRSTFAKSLHNKQNKMHYIPNYVDTEQYHSINKRSDGKIKIIFPRRCSPERGVQLVFKILPVIIAKYENVVFDFVGFAHGKKITKDIKELTSRFPSKVNHYICEPDEMVGIYQSADISLIPTLFSEGTSLSCLEAMACGNVVISTNIGGLPNLVINGYNGILINPDEQELIVALDKVIANKELRNELSQNAIKVAKTFDKGVWVKSWENIITSVENHQYHDHMIKS